MRVCAPCTQTYTPLSETCVILCTVRSLSKTGDAAPGEMNSRGKEAGMGKAFLEKIRFKPDFEEWRGFLGQ